MIKSRFLFCVAVLAISLLGGCATYENPASSTATTSTIAVQSRARFPWVLEIHEIDGVRTTTGLELKRRNQFVVTAGRHTFGVRHQNTMYAQYHELWLEVEPGQIYTLKSRDSGRGIGLEAYFVNAMGKEVGGVVVKKKE